MKKFFCIVICFFISSSAYANCHQCCTTPSDVVYCIFSDDSTGCSGGCDCCPTAGQIGSNPDGTYFCCKGETPQVTDIQGKDGYRMCCKAGEEAYANGDTGTCCNGTVTYGPPATVTESTTQADYSWHCCENGGSWTMTFEDSTSYGYTAYYGCYGQGFCSTYNKGTRWEKVTDYQTGDGAGHTYMNAQIYACAPQDCPDIGSSQREWHHRSYTNETSSYDGYSCCFYDSTGCEDNDHWCCYDLILDAVYR